LIIATSHAHAVTPPADRTQLHFDRDFRFTL
jgi:hypothetical protein